MYFYNYLCIANIDTMIVYHQECNPLAEISFVQRMRYVLQYVLDIVIYYYYVSDVSKSFSIS